MPSSTPSRYLFSNVRSYAVASTTMLLRIWAVEPHAHWLVAGA